MQTAKTLIRLGRYQGWSESSLGAQVILLVLSCGSSDMKKSQKRWQRLLLHLNLWKHDGRIRAANRHIYKFVLIDCWMLFSCFAEIFSFVYAYANVWFYYSVNYGIDKNNWDQQQTCLIITFWCHVFVCWQWNLVQWLLFSSYKLMLETNFTYWKLICHDLSFLPTSYSLNYKVPALLQFLMPRFLSVEMPDWRTVASTPAYLSSENDCHLVPYSVKYRKNLKFSGQTGLSKQCRPRSDCSWSLIRVYTVCHSFCVLLRHYCMVKSYWSNFRFITAIISSAPISTMFTVGHYMSHVMRKPVYVICEQQRRRSDCTSAQSDQHLCCSLPR